MYIFDNRILYKIPLRSCYQIQQESPSALNIPRYKWSLGFCSPYRFIPGSWEISNRPHNGRSRFTARP